MYYSQVEKHEPDPLVKPLLDSDHGSVDSNQGMLKDDSTSAGTSPAGSKSATNKYNEYLAGRIYASNAPKILLETISARTAALIIALTYIFFILGFCIDFYTTYKSFHSSNFKLTALPCGTQMAPGEGGAGQDYWSCSSGKYWNSTITHLTNVISVKLDVEQTNVTSIFSNITDPFDIMYNIDLWACYNKDGCGSQFASNSYYTNDPDTWQHVYTQNEQRLHIDVAVDVNKDGDIEDLSKSLIPSTFQNQESIPTNGLVKSYFISVEYTDDPYNIFMNEKNDSYHYTTYNFDVVERPRQLPVNAITIVLLFVTLVVLVWYVWMLCHQKKVLSEQKWVVAYFVLLVMFQNPVYCTIVFYKEAPSAEAAYASYVIGYIAQSGLFILWLLFADSVHRKTTTKSYFYLPKVLIGVVIFTFGILILTFQFPGLSAHTKEHTRSAVEAVANWSPALRKNFIAFTIMYLVLIWLWTIWWFIRLFLTGQKLKKLPYMSTRYIQLSYRFFSLQATLVTLYYFFQYVIVIVFITQGVTTSYDSITLTDNINILFRQQTQLFGKTLFLTVYALVISFLFLPANLMDNKQGLLASLSATYVISEQEHRILVKTRRIMMNSVKRNLLNQMSLVNQLVGARADVFCIDLSLKLRNVAFQAYYDPVGLNSASGYDGHMNLEPIGFELIDLTYNAEHEVFCFICREKDTGRLVVAFRGTASKRQMEANLKYTQRAIVFGSLTTATLDHLDGLTIKPSELDDERYELDSVSDDEADETDLGLESQHGSARNNNYSNAGSHNSNEESFNFRETIADGAGVVQGGIKRVMQGAAGVTHAVVDRAGAVVDATAGLVATAASKTPGLKNIVKLYVHSGFWEAYEHVREFIHAILRRELSRNPTTVFFTGHSLGGALATFAALDVTLHTVPRVNAWLKHQEKMKIRRPDVEQPDSRQSIFSSLSRTFTGTLGPITHFASSTFLPRASTFNNDGAAAASTQNQQSLKPPPFVKKIKVFMYNYGSPRVGNGNFATFYDKMVPNSYRVVVDGDIVPALPPQSKYRHVGTEILIDSVGAGSIIIDPSFVERWLRTHMKSSVAVHSLLVYRKGLLGIKLSAEFMRANANARDSVDPLRLALKVRVHQQVSSILDENAGIAAELVPKEQAEREDAVEDEEGRLPSVSEVVERNTPCVSNDGDAERVGSPALAMELISTVESGGSEKSPTGGSEKALNPMVLAQQRSQRAAKLAAALEAKADRESGGAGLAAQHYAHDVEQMEMLKSQMAAMRPGGPVRWISKHILKPDGSGADSASTKSGKTSKSGRQELNKPLERSDSGSSGKGGATVNSSSKGWQGDGGDGNFSNV